MYSFILVLIKLLVYYKINLKHCYAGNMIVLSPKAYNKVIISEKANL